MRLTFLTLASLFSLFQFVAYSQSALDLDGIDDYVDCGNQFNLTSYTKEFWFNWDGVADLNNIIAGSFENRHAIWAPSFEQNRVTAGHNGDWDVVEDSVPVPIGQWTHYAVTYDGTTGEMILYRNGMQVSNGNAGAGFVLTHINLGAYLDPDGSLNIMSGKIDEIRLWNAVRTPLEIQINYNQCISGSETGLEAYYIFEDGAGSSVLSDITGNNHDGTLTNMDPNTDWVIGQGSCNGTLPQLEIKAFIQGPYNAGSLQDDLRVAGLIPTLSPYPDALVCDASVFNVTGVDAVIDWVWVELRDLDTTTVVYATSAFIQADGHVVTIDGSSFLVPEIADGNYYLVLDHRNHLGIMTATSIAMSGTPVVLDFTDGSTLAFGSDAQTVLMNGDLALWAGDVNGDGMIKYLGPDNDTNGIKDNVLDLSNGNPTGSNFFAYTGYDNADVNLNGQIKYLGPNNDSNTVKDIVLAHPINTPLSNYFPIIGQVPN